MKHVILTSMPDKAITRSWNAFLADIPLATHYMTANYFTDPYVSGERFAVLAADEAGDVTAVITGIIDGEKIGSGLSCRPQMAFRDKTDRGAAADALIAGLDEISDGRKLIELHSWSHVDELMRPDMTVKPSTAETSVVMLDLAGGADAIFSQFSRNRRNNIRAATKRSDVEIKELETDVELDELYQLHCEWNKRKGNPADTFERMQTATSLRENRRIFIAKTDGKVIAGSFFRFCPDGVVEYSANFSLQEDQKLRPNDLIVWHAIKWACESGFSHFSMGGSHLFLRRFGGDVVTTYRYARDDRPFGIQRLKTNVRELGVETYRRLPDNVRAGVRRVFAR